MRQKFFGFVVCMIVLALCGCTYEDAQTSSESTQPHVYVEPSPSPVFLLPEQLRVNEPIMHRGVTASHPLPASGPCSFSSAHQSSMADIDYSKLFILSSVLSNSIGRVHVENSVTVSWPKDVYSELRKASPNLRNDHVSIFRISRESFESMIRQNEGLEDLIVQLGLLHMDSFFVTSYGCVSLNDIK